MTITPAPEETTTVTAVTEPHEVAHEPLDALEGDQMTNEGDEVAHEVADEGDDETKTNLNAEAAKYRHQRKAVEADLETTNQAITAAEQTLLDLKRDHIFSATNGTKPGFELLPATAFWKLYPDTDQFIDADGNVDLEKIKAAKHEACTNLGIRSGPRPPLPLPLQGNQQDSPSAPRWNTTF